jgi:hypothetical protein
LYKDHFIAKFFAKPARFLIEGATVTVIVLVELVLAGFGHKTQIEPNLFESHKMAKVRELLSLGILPGFSQQLCQIEVQCK